MRQLDYRELKQRLGRVRAAQFAQLASVELPKALSDLWGRAYEDAWPQADLVSVTLSSFSYLFDLSLDRCVGAYGVMIGRNPIPRDHARMAGYPKGEGAKYHRGHLIPHSGHGGTDINLFVQLGKVNIGPFRALEKRAVEAPGAFYFVRLLYRSADPALRPAGVEQGLILPGDSPQLELRAFPN